VIGHPDGVPRWSVLLFVIVFAAVVALVVADRDAVTQPPPEPTTTPTPTPTATPPAGLDAHLRALQRIASEHGGTRAAGSGGDMATADYIEERLQGAGYRVTRVRFRVPYYRESAPPRLVAGGRRVRPVRTMQFSPGGRAAGRVRAAGLGCAAADFEALRTGEIALVERGTCFFRVKAVNAQRAGAAAVLVVDQAERPVAGSLQRPGLRIPALALGAGAGEGLEGRRVRVRVRAVSERRETSSVIGESGPADAPRVVMAGGHLDSVPAGPGLNDNGSGVAALLQIADRLAGQDRPLRFAFWGAEEIGLVGSRRYVRALSRTERRRIAAYVNLDMVGSPEGELEVYDTDDRVEAALRRGLPRRTGEVRLEGNSDHASFEAAGIPVGGLFTGLDDCYHQRCDGLANVDQRLAARAARATEAALLQLSQA
jgi:Zn-dependent M28 family amino/carboxypeptidase